MLDIKVINQEIRKLENSDVTNYYVCDRLATLYIVKDHYRAAAADSVQQPMSSPGMSSPMK
jgi:hypothetical protein